jgi:hypothetical protein
MKARVERILELLTDEVVDRVADRVDSRVDERMQERVQIPPGKAAVEEGPRVVAEPAAPSIARLQEETVLAEVIEERPVPVLEQVEEEVSAELEQDVEPLSSALPSHAARLMARLALGLLVAIVLINLPLNRHGVTLATVLPDSAALIIRDGLVVKEQDDPEIYVYQDGRFRWISSLDAFEHYGYTWGDVRVVDDGFLAPFEVGAPIHVLLKCYQSPHIYRLEQGQKRWIRDIETFTAEGHIWEDVRFVSCGYLRGLPDGETIPPDSGPPPQP